MEVRKLVESDWKQYKSLRLLSLSQSPHSFENSVQDESSLTDEEWIRRVTPSEDAFIIGAFDDSAIVGIAGFARACKGKIRHKSYVWGVFVEPEYRSNGVAKELLGVLLFSVTDIKGISQVQLTVGSGNVAAISLYEKFGFTTYGTEIDAIRVSGRSYDELLMAYVVNET